MKTKHGWVVLALTIGTSLYIAGCGGGGSSGSTAATNAGSCSLTSGGFTTCYDYTGSGYTTSSAQTACANTSSGGVTGTYSASSCTTSGRVGSCQIYQGQSSEEYVRYFTGWSGAAAQSNCSSLSGTYTSG